MVYLLQVLVAIVEKKMDMEPPYKTSLYINNLCPTHSQEKHLAWGGVRVGSFKGTYNLEEVELWGHWKILKNLNTVLQTIHYLSKTSI